ncbi:response regulator [Flavobacterium sp.]|uniref:response regulator n=1 Tax=Flavobacterium sp. TaxID=239 RepID=UPI0039E70D04
MEHNSKKKVLIVEDQFIEAHDLQLIIEKAGYDVVGIARSVAQAVELLEQVKPDLVFLDIILKGNETGIDLAKRLQENHIGFVYISANSSKSILEEAKKTQPYGFIVKPFREQDVIITLEIACYRHKHSLESLLLQQNLLQKSIETIARNESKWEQAVIEFGTAVQPHLPFDYMECGFIDRTSENNQSIGLLRRNLDEYQIITADKLAKTAGLQKQELLRMYEHSPKVESPQLCGHQELAELCRESPIRRLVATTFGIKSFLAFPLQVKEDRIFHFFFYNRQPVVYETAHLDLLAGLERNLAAFCCAACRPCPTHDNSVGPTHCRTGTDRTHCFWNDDRQQRENALGVRPDPKGSAYRNLGVDPRRKRYR